MSGKLITFEGADGAAKNTQIKLLEERLIQNEYKVKTYAFPQYETETGKLIAKYLIGGFGDINSVPSEFISLAYASDRAKCANEINNYLNQGYIVLCDRYTYSNLFNAAKLPQEKQDEFITWFENLEFKCLNIPKPDFNYYLYVTPEISFKRIKERGLRNYQNNKEDIHESNKKLLTDTINLYLNFAKDKPNWVIIDEMDGVDQKPIDDVHRLIFKDIIPKLYSHK